MKTHTFISPLAVFLPRKTMQDKKMILNKNGERNWNPFVYKAAKQAYVEAMRSQLEGVVLRPTVIITLTYYKPTRRRSDRSNVLTMHEKFFCDALVDLGCLEDDSDEYIASTTYRGGTLDKANPRVVIEVTEID